VFITLREAKNVKYGHFMQPGRSMQISVELVDQSETAEGKLATLKVRRSGRDGHGIGPPDVCPLQLAGPQPRLGVLMNRLYTACAVRTWCYAPTDDE